MNEHPRERTGTRPVRRRRRGAASAPVGFWSLGILLLCAVVFAGGFFLGRASALEPERRSGEEGQTAQGLVRLPQRRPRRHLRPCRSPTPGT